MKYMMLALFLGALVLTAGLAGLGGVLADDIPEAEQRDKANKLMQAGNWKDAYNLLSKLLVDPKSDPMKVPARKSSDGTR
jgi:hypothetical protein